MEYGTYSRLRYAMSPHEMKKERKNKPLKYMNKQTNFNNEFYYKVNSNDFYFKTKTFIRPHNGGLLWNSYCLEIFT